MRTRTGRRGGALRRRGLQGPFLVAWSLPIERHKGLVELARCRSDLSLRLLAFRALQYQSGQGVQVVAAVFEHIDQYGFKRGGALAPCLR